MFRLFLCFLLGALAAPLAHAQESPPKIAFWNVQFSDEALGLDQERLERVALWLHEAKIEVSWLRSDQISDEKQFNAQKFDAIFLPGDPLLRWLETPLEKFAREGGVLVAIHTQKQPWSVPLVPDVNGKPRRQPQAKTLETLAQLFGAKWSAPRESALIHEVAPILQQNWPQNAETTPDATAPVMWQIRHVMPILNVQTEEKTVVEPLIFSREESGEKTAPAAFELRNGAARAVIVGDRYWSDAPNEGGWNGAPQFWAQIARLCAAKPKN